MTAPGLVVLPEQAWESIKAELAALRLALLDAVSKQSGVPVLAMSRDEAAECLRLGLNSVDTLIQSGELPSAVVCGRRLVTVDDAREYLANRVAANKATPEAFKRPPRSRRRAARAAPPPP